MQSRTELPNIAPEVTPRPINHRGRASRLASSASHVGAIGTVLAQRHLRNLLACPDMPTLGQPDVKKP